MKSLDNTESFAVWCSSCSSEPAMVSLEIEYDGEWVDFPVGEKCLTTLQEADRIE